MRHFTPRPGTRSAVRHLKNPFLDIAAFDAVVRALVQNNPLGCTSYMSAGRNQPPVAVVREMYTAKFVYLDTDKKQIGRGQETYNSVEGYGNGIAAVISNMANIAAHRGKVRHIPDADLFSVLMRCHDHNGELYFLSQARDRMTLSSYTDDAIRARAGHWAESVPALA
jgi:hypothetical protein